MRWICLTGLLLLTLLPAQAGHSAPKILLRIHVQTTGEGLSNMQATTIALPPNGEQIQIRALPEVTEGELIDATQDASGRIHFLFNHEGQVSLSAVTAENQGRILVVFINGFIVYAPIIDTQIVNGELVLPHPINPQALQFLQDMARRNVRQAAKT